MRSLISIVSFFFLGVLLLIPAGAIAQTELSAAATPPIAQPLMREGDFATALVAALNLGSVTDEADAESTLSAAGIMPQNGWIADYPVTPDIVGELQTSISAAADAGKLSMGRDAALAAFQGIINGNSMAVRVNPDQSPVEMPPADYPDSADLSDYYYSEGPPVVTYYAPPPDYAYLYTWVPYPFWWSDFWFPGFYVLVDFDVIVHGYGHGHAVFCTNHYRDRASGRMLRIDPTNRYRGGTFSGTASAFRASPSAERGAQSILNKSEAYRQARGYGVARTYSATRSSAFDRSVNSSIERAASDRGFQSRAAAHQVPSSGYTGGGVSRGGVSRGGGGGGARGYHGGGRSR